MVALGGKGRLQCFGVCHHRAKFGEWKLGSPLSDTRLPEEDGTAIRQLDRQRNRGKKRTEGDQGGSSHKYVDRALQDSGASDQDLPGALLEVEAQARGLPTSFPAVPSRKFCDQ